MKFPQMCFSDGFRHILRNQNRDDCINGQYLDIFSMLQEINSPDSLENCKAVKLP